MFLKIFVFLHHVSVLLNYCPVVLYNQQSPNSVAYNYQQLFLTIPVGVGWVLSQVQLVCGFSPGLLHVSPILLGPVSFRSILFTRQKAGAQEQAQPCKHFYYFFNVILLFF